MDTKITEELSCVKKVLREKTSHDLFREKHENERIVVCINKYLYRNVRENVKTGGNDVRETDEKRHDAS